MSRGRSVNATYTASLSQLRTIDNIQHARQLSSNKRIILPFLNFNAHSTLSPTLVEFQPCSTRDDGLSTTAEAGVSGCARAQVDAAINEAQLRFVPEVFAKFTIMVYLAVIC